MNIILIREPIPPQNLYRLITEFPHYKFIQASQESLLSLGKEQLKSVEIFYGHRLISEELDLMPLLRWVHVTSPYMDEICVNEILKKEHILVTETGNFDVDRVGEFAFASMLAFAKNLFLWENYSQNPSALNENSIKEGMWTASNRILLQISLNSIGTEIARRAKLGEFKVWGVQEKKSFHPFCEKVFSYDQLHEVLPQVDVVSISLTSDQEPLLKKKEFNLMKKNSVLLVFGSGASIDIEALAELDHSKFRGILIDAHFKKALPKNSKLWGSPHVIICPEVGAYPKKEDDSTFKIFLYNLWQFLHGNFSEMKGIVSSWE